MNRKTMTQIDSFKVIGISINTTNQNNKSAEDISNLWQRFYSENIQDQIPNKTSSDVYSIYTDYETDYTGKYTSIIGVKVNSLDEIPDGFIGWEFRGGTYRKLVAKGEMPNAVIETWAKIWKKDSELKRKYTSDFEVYSDRSQRGDNSEVDIYIAVE